MAEAVRTTRAVTSTGEPSGRCARRYNCSPRATFWLRWKSAPEVEMSSVSVGSLQAAPSSARPETTTGSRSAIRSANRLSSLFGGLDISEGRRRKAEGSENTEADARQHSLRLTAFRLLPSAFYDHSFHS